MPRGRPRKNSEDEDKKVRKKGNYEEFTSYIYKVIKNLHPDTGVSKKGMMVLNSITNDLFEKISIEATTLARYHSKQTLSANDIQAALKLLLPQEMTEHIIAEGLSAIDKYKKSREESKAMRDEED